MIICGYAGIGKSFLANNVARVIDLESTPFETDWERYAKCAIHYDKNGYIVLLSCHQGLRDELERQKASFITIIPSPSDKEIYRKIYEGMGNTSEFIEVQMNFWDEWTKPKRHCGEVIRYLEPGGERLWDYMEKMNRKPDGACYFCTYDGCPVPEGHKAECGPAFNIEDDCCGVM